MASPFTQGLIVQRRAVSLHWHEGGMAELHAWGVLRRWQFFLPSYLPLGWCWLADWLPLPPPPPSHLADQRLRDWTARGMLHERGFLQRALVLPDAGGGGRADWWERVGGWVAGSGQGTGKKPPDRAECARVQPAPGRPTHPPLRRPPFASQCRHPSPLPLLLPQAILDMARTTFIILMLTVSALLFIADNDRLVLQPLERMVRKVGPLSLD